MTINAAMALAYAGCALLALGCRAGRADRFWVAAAALLAVLAALRSVHAYEVLPGDLRWLLVESGWYAQRRPIQLAATLLFAAAAGGGWLLLARRAGREDRPAGAAAALLAVLLGFIAARASSLRPVDDLLDVRLAGGLKRSQAVEGLLLLALAGCFAAVRLRRRARPGPQADSA